MGNTQSTEIHEPRSSQQQNSVDSNSQVSIVTLIWYDPNMNSTFKYAQTKKMLSKITDDVRFYVVETEFLTYLRTSQPTSIVLILPGHVAADILPELHDLTHIESVHIYRGIELLDQLPVADTRKVKSRSNERNKLKAALERTLRHDNVFYLFDSRTHTSTWDPTTRNVELFWHQLLLEIVLLEQQGIQIKESKCDFIQFCREYIGDAYENDRRYIDYLETVYQPNDAIGEYKKGNFLSQLINRAIRIGDIEELYRVRYYITHLCRNLSEQSKLYRAEQKRLGKTVLTLFRAQQLSREEGARLRASENTSIATRSFLSTSLNPDVSTCFSGCSPENLSVLFVITVDLDQVPEMILADISRIGDMADEEEVLFGINATFEIDKQFQRDDDGQWIIQMHATNRGAEIANDANAYLKHRSSEILNYSSSTWISIYFILAQLLIEIGQYGKAVKFLEKIRPTTDNERAYLYLLLADAKISSHSPEENTLDDGIRLLKKSTELFTSLGNEGAVAHTLRRHADALVLKKEYKEAEAFYRAAKTRYEIGGQNENIANCNNGLGDVYLGLRKYPEAKSQYEKVLNWRKSHLPDEHPAIARSHYSLGRYYYSMGNNDANAEWHLNQALERKKKIYSLDHPSIQCNKRLLEEVSAAYRQ